MATRSRLLSPLCAGAILAGTAAAASMPTGARFGPWQVISISSVSGISGDDAFATLVQETRRGTLQVEWEQGGPVAVSIDLRRCGRGADEFERGYSIPQAQWLALPDGGAARLQADFAAWLREAGRACRQRAAAWRLDRLGPAARDFTARVRALGAR